MDIIQELLEDEDTPIFNALKKKYRNPMLEFVEETNYYSPIFVELREKYEKPMTALEEKPDEDLIEIPVVDFRTQQIENTSIEESEMRYLYEQNRSKDALMKEMDRQFQISLDELEEWRLRQEAAIAILQIEKDELIDALIKTVSYVGNDMLPPIDGWSWYDALKKFRPKSAENYAKVYAESGGPKERTNLQMHIDEMTETQRRFKSEYLEFLTRDPGFVSTFNDGYTIGMDEPTVVQEDNADRRSPEDPYTVTVSQQIHFNPSVRQARVENDAYSDSSHSMKGES